LWPVVGRWARSPPQTPESAFAPSYDAWGRSPAPNTSNCFTANSDDRREAVGELMTDHSAGVASATIYRRKRFDQDDFVEFD
jgi:hypothetical protein